MAAIGAFAPFSQVQRLYTNLTELKKSAKLLPFEEMV